MQRKTEPRMKRIPANLWRAVLRDGPKFRRECVVSEKRNLSRSREGTEGRTIQKTGGLTLPCSRPARCALRGICDVHPRHDSVARLCRPKIQAQSAVSPVKKTLARESEKILANEIMHKTHRIACGLKMDSDCLYTRFCAERLSEMPRDSNCTNPPKKFRLAMPHCLVSPMLSARIPSEA